MAEKVGEIYYDVTLETGDLIRQQRKVDSELQRTSKSMDDFGSRVTAVASAVGVLVAAMAAVKVAKLADEFRMLSARVDIAAGSMEAGAQAFSELVAISQRTQTSVAANVELFNRLNTSMKAMGGTQEDTLRLTELVSKSMRISGASVQEAASTVRQFGQALGKGNLNGDELTSLLENAPYLARKMAEGLGVPIGALKDLGEQGKLTSDVIVNAINKAANDIERDFQKVPQTIEAALQVAQDAAGLAALKFDELSGTSAALAGVTKGLGDVLTELAKQIGAANEQAGALGRNDAVVSWANTSRVALSYVVDAADLVWQTLSVLGRNVAFVFKAVGTEVGGIGAQIAAVARGDFAGAAAIGDMMKADAEQRRRELDAADAKTVARAKLAGQQMREAWEQGAGGGRGAMARGFEPSKLTAPEGSGGKGSKKAKFDTEAYLADLRKREASEIEVINITEQEELRKLGLRKDKHKAYEEAKTLITSNAEKARQELVAKTQIDIDRAREESDRKAEQQRQDRERGRAGARQAIANSNPVDQVKLWEEEELARQEAARQLDLQNTQVYEDAKVAIRLQAAEKIKQIQDGLRAQEAMVMSATLQGYGQLFGGVADLTRTFAGEQSGAYKAMFAISKAFAIADATVKLGQAIMNANFSAPWPTNFAAMASVASAGAGVISSIQGANFGGGRQYGGPVSAGTMYRVNETGRPEMFTSANGNQYMLPTASGQVTAADKVGQGAGVAWTIIVNEAPPGTTATVDDTAKTVTIAVATVAQQIASNTGPVWNAMRGATNVKGRTE